MVTTNIIYDRKHQAKKSGKGTLEIRTTCERDSFYISTGVRVRESEWKAGRVVNRPDADALNKRLAVIYELVSSETDACIKEGRAIDLSGLRNRIKTTIEAHSGEPTLLNWIEEQLPLLGVSEGTLKHYYPLVNRLREYGKLLRWQDVTVENIYNFDAWLHGQKKHFGKGEKTRNGAEKEQLSDAGIYNYHKCLKALLTRADKFGKIDRNPYERLKGQFKRGDKESVEYLTEDEMLTFERVILPVGSPVDIAHDLFIFQMYTGLPYSDMQSFDIGDYKWDGARWNRIGQRIKTGVPYVSSILPPALRVLEKYDMKIPKMNNADYNRHLKTIQTLTGIKTRLHSHLARHTFATYMLRNGAKIENVSRMLGHTNITQTQRYAKVLAQSVHDDFDMIEQKMNNNQKHKEL